MIQGGSSLPGFLRERTESFHPASVSAYYGVSKTRRSELLQAWLAEGWITRSGQGPVTTYKLAPFAVEMNPITQV